MSHRDTVAEAPAGFRILAHTGTCPIAAIAEPSRRFFGLQFHPEVVHTTNGRQVLSNFLFDMCGCERDWDARHRAPQIEAEIRECVGDRNVFFFVSGGVDSTVAYTLCLRALGPGRVRGVYVDTGLMREGETEFVVRTFEGLGGDGLAVEDAGPRFLGPLAEVSDPERKRRIIGEEFVRVQERVIEANHLLDGSWILGQGTIYPYTIESGGTAKAAVIKTHHNRVAGIQKLIEAKRIVEPLTSLYKDEVREVGRELGLPEELIERHPFPGPGLAIRCLSVDVEAPVRAVSEGYILPVRSVGVQGDDRSYAPVLAIEELDHAAATGLINRMEDINRVVARVRTKAPLSGMRVRPGGLSAGRLGRLRHADAVVRRLAHESGFDKSVWQFPVVLIPLGTQEAPDSVVLRPVDSVDGMTARSVAMGPDLLCLMARELLEIEGIGGVFYDLTHKPPATIEWE
jgi:GMP synthase (glutamine-hydrolysing)